MANNETVRNEIDPLQADIQHDTEQRDAIFGKRVADKENGNLFKYYLFNSSSFREVLFQ